MILKKWAYQLKLAIPLGRSSRIHRVFIEALHKAIVAQDPYTAKHQEHVANFAARIAMDLKWPVKKIEGLFLAGLVHDLGKVAIPQEILVKSDPLSSSEIALIRKHPETAYEILCDIHFPWPIAEVVRQHHERLDGSGYPRGLMSDDILDEAKILAIADSIEAIALDRPYRPGLGIRSALDLVRSQTRVKLDARYVEVACRLIEEYAEKVFD